MPTSIKGGGGSKKLNATATADKVLSPYTFSSDGKNVQTGSMVNRGAVSQSLAINGTYTIPAGYHNGSGKVTQSISTLGATTYTPKTTNQTIASGKYLSGTQTIKGDSNLVASNIKSGTSIFGVTGTLGAIKRTYTYFLYSDTKTVTFSNAIDVNNTIIEISYISSGQSGGYLLASEGGKVLNTSVSCTSTTLTVTTGYNYYVMIRVIEFANTIKSFQALNGALTSSKALTLYGSSTTQDCMCFTIESVDTSKTLVLGHGNRNGGNNGSAPAILVDSTTVYVTTAGYSYNYIYAGVIEFK